MDLITAALANPINRKILERLPMLGAPQACLVAGSVYQAFWNGLSERPVAEGVKDYDLFYFDGSDLSYEAEDVVVRRAGALFADLDVLVDVKNQARVHLWYPQRFGGDYPKLEKVEDGIARFLVRSTCIGLMRRVTIAFPSIEPRADVTRTASPLDTPRSLASSSGISMKNSGCSWTVYGLFFVQ